MVVSEYLENEEAMARSGRYKLIVGTGARHRQDGYATRSPSPAPTSGSTTSRPTPGRPPTSATAPSWPRSPTISATQLHDRLVTTRGARPPVPAGLSEIEAIRWCLVPQD